MIKYEGTKRTYRIISAFWHLERHLEIIYLTHWGRVTHICISKLDIISSDNGLSPDRRQAIVWTNAGMLLIGSLGTNFNEILSEIQTFSFKKMHLKISSVKSRPIPHHSRPKVTFYVAVVWLQMVDWYICSLIQYILFVPGDCKAYATNSILAVSPGIQGMWFHSHDGPRYG